MMVGSRALAFLVLLAGSAGVSSSPCELALVRPRHGGGLACNFSNHREEDMDRMTADEKI